MRKLDGGVWFRYQQLKMRLTHWAGDEINVSLQTSFSNAFSWKKLFEFRLKFHWSLFPRAQFPIIQHWFRQWLGAVQAPSHYLNQWWLVYGQIYASLSLVMHIDHQIIPVKACHMFWVKPFSEPMMTYHKTNLIWCYLVAILSQFQCFHIKKFIFLSTHYQHRNISVIHPNA